MIRAGDQRGVYGLRTAIVRPQTFSDSYQLESKDEDLVVNCLCKLQDGLKVSTREATEALQQYRTLHGEMGRLQSLLNRPSRFPLMSSSLYMQEKSFKDRTEKIIQAKEKEIVDLKQKLIETTARLSALVGTQVTNVDSKKSDLTDPIKPLQLAEDFRAILDNEWKMAYEELEVALEKEKILVYLGKATWLAYEFAKDMVEQQMTALMKKEIDILRIMARPIYEEKERRKPLVSEGTAALKFHRDETFQLLKNYMRCLARSSVPGVKQIFLTLMTRTPPEKGGTLTDGVRKFILKIAELTYLMCIQDPPMYLEWVRFGDILDPDKYKPFSGEGTKIVGTIWPVVLQYQDGPVMSRGVVDVMYGQVVFPKITDTRF